MKLETYSGPPLMRLSVPHVLSANYDTTDELTSPNSSEQSLEIDADEIETQKSLLLDRLMLRVYSMFDTRGADRQHQQSASESAKGSSSESPLESKPCRTLKHGSSGNEGDEEKDKRSDDHISKKPRKLKVSNEGLKTERKKPFACPFFKHDPGRYCTARQCAGPTGWETIARLK